MKNVVKNMVNGNWAAADDKGRRDRLRVPLKNEMVLI